MAEANSIHQIAHSRTPLSTWLGIVLLFALFGVIVLAIIGPMPRSSDYEETRAKKRMENLKTVHEDAEKSLNSYAWVDKNKGVVRIPITRAMELTVADLAQKKPAPAGPITTPAPQAPAAPGSPAPAVAPQPGAQRTGSPSAAASAASASPAAAQTAASPSQQASAASPSSAAQSASSATGSPAPSASP